MLRTRVRGLLSYSHSLRTRCVELVRKFSTHVNEKEKQLLLLSGIRRLPANIAKRRDAVSTEIGTPLKYLPEKSPLQFMKSTFKIGLSVALFFVMMVVYAFATSSKEEEILSKVLISNIRELRSSASKSLQSSYKSKGTITCSKHTITWYSVGPDNASKVIILASEDEDSSLFGLVFMSLSKQYPDVRVITYNLSLNEEAQMKPISMNSRMRCLDALVDELVSSKSHVYLVSQGSGVWAQLTWAGSTISRRNAPLVSGVLSLAPMLSYDSQTHDPFLRVTSVSRSMSNSNVSLGSNNAGAPSADSGSACVLRSDELSFLETFVSGGLKDKSSKKDIKVSVLTMSPDAIKSMYPDRSAQLRSLLLWEASSNDVGRSLLAPSEKRALEKRRGTAKVDMIAEIEGDYVVQPHFESNTKDSSKDLSFFNQFMSWALKSPSFDEGTSPSAWFLESRLKTWLRRTFAASGLLHMGISLEESYIFRYFQAERKLFFPNVQVAHVNDPSSAATLKPQSAILSPTLEKSIQTTVVSLPLQAPDAVVAQIARLVDE
jgi:hypothetical protein